MASVAPERRQRLTCDEYFRMGERGVFAPEARVELIDGKIFDRVPINSPHSGTLIRLNQMLTRALRDSTFVLAGRSRSRITTGVSRSTARRV